MATSPFKVKNVFSEVKNTGKSTVTPTKTVTQPAGTVNVPVVQSVPVVTTPTKTVTATTPVAQTAKSAIDASIIPADLASNPYFNSLDDNSKILALYTYYATNASNEQEKDRYTKALEEAKSESTPYFNEQINMAVDSLTRSITSIEADLTSKEKTLQDRISNLQNDLTYNKDYLSADEQSQLSKQLLAYKRDLSSLQTNVASRGITSSSIAAKATDLLAQENQGTVESIQRTTAKQLRDLQTSTDAQIAEYNQNIIDAQRAAAESKTEATRTAEKYLGSDYLSNIPGVGSYALGGISGSIKEDQAADILKRTNALMGNQ